MLFWAFRSFSAFPGGKRPSAASGPGAAEETIIDVGGFIPTAASPRVPAPRCALCANGLFRHESKITMFASPLKLFITSST